MSEAVNGLYLCGYSPKTGIIVTYFAVLGLQTEVNSNRCEPPPQFEAELLRSTMLPLAGR
jgi:hypothetical protein